METPLRLAVATTALGRPLARALAEAAALGARGAQIEIPSELSPLEMGKTARREFLHRLDQLGLAVASLHVTLPRPLFDLEHLDRSIDRVRTALELAFALKCSAVTFRPGRIPAGEPTAERPAASAEWDLLRQVLDDLARHANRVGGVPAVIPSGEPPELLQRLLGTVSSGPIGVDFDPAVYAMSGVSATDALRQLHTQVLHVQGRDGVRDFDGSGIEVPLGRGEVDWIELAALLGEMEYRGWITVQRHQGEQRARDCAAALEYLKRIQ